MTLENNLRKTYISKLQVVLKWINLKKNQSSLKRMLYYLGLKEHNLIIIILICSGKRK